MKAALEEAINAILAEKDVNIGHIQDITDLFAQAAEAAADAAFDIPEVMHEKLSDLSPKATANVLIALIWNLYSFKTGDLNRRGRLLAFQIAKLLSPVEAAAFCNLAQLIKENVEKNHAQS